MVRGGRPVVSAGMTDRDIIERLGTVTGVGSVTGPYEKGTYKPYYAFRVTAQYDAYALMVALYEWLGDRRREQIRSAISAWNIWAAGKDDRVRRGLNHPNSMLTAAAVQEILAQYDGRRFAKGQQKRLAEKFGVSTSTINRVVNMSESYVS